MLTLRNLKEVPFFTMGAGAEVSVRNNSSCSRFSNGEVQCWGDNTNGQLGTNDKTTPVTMARTVCASAGCMTSLSGASQVSMGGTFACAVSGGLVRCWGQGGLGQLGDGTFNERLFAGASMASGVQRVVTASVHACALEGAETVRCWGVNSDGQLGDADATRTNKNVPTPIVW
jgi:alpha-tubulin suppressor-like RCC1 family protein